MLLLLDRCTATWVAIQRAATMSEALDAKLLVIHAVPDGAATHPALVTSQVVDLLRARALHRGFEIEVLPGSMVDRAREVRRKHEVAMVIIDATSGPKAACHLATALDVPVLVARDARPGGEWIAASDMQHLDFPVLTTARRLATALDREVLYFHNASPVAVTAGDPMAGPASYLGMLELQDSAAAAKRARLERLAGEDERAHSLLTRSGSTVEALVDLARDRDADAIVIGTHPRSWWSRLLGRGTTEKLVANSPRSVLIVPLAGSM